MLALQRQGYLRQLDRLAAKRSAIQPQRIVLVMTFNIFPVVYFAVPRSLLARAGNGLAMVAWGPWRQRLARLRGRDAADASPALARRGMLVGVYSRHRGVWRTGALGSRAGVVMLTVGNEKKLADQPVDPPALRCCRPLLMAVALFALRLQTAGGGERGHQRHR